ncbi:MAG: phosphatase PAP2 family protein [Candidatus Binatia bacterium]
MTPDPSALYGAAGLALAFFALTAAVVIPGSAVKRFDDSVVAALARRRSDQVDRVIGPLSMLATAEPLTVQGFVAFMMILVTLERTAALHFAVAAIGAGILIRLLKTAVARQRPAVPPLIGWLRGSSYPSGDLLTATTIYLTLAFIVDPHLPDRTASTVLFTLVAALLALLGACRVYAGVHHPSDVVAGALAGAAWALFVTAWFP